MVATTGMKMVEKMVVKKVDMKEMTLAAMTD